MASCLKDKMYKIVSVSEFLDPHFHVHVHSVILSFSQKILYNEKKSFPTPKPL